MDFKKLDRLLVTSFLPPFVATFFIALFVLVMQTLWLYIDEIAGKGVGFFLMVELLAYMSVSMIPLALPIAVLVSSVMVMGNLSENYELSSFKSAGISLERVMRPLLGVVFVITIFSFFCSNNFIPVSNLKFRSRLYDIRKQKPTLNMEEGLFNDDFKGYSIRIGKKSPNNKTIYNVLIVDYSESSDGRLAEISADSGEMYITEDERFFIMQLFEGFQYQEGSVGSGSSAKTPFIRTHFREWRKVFDLKEFEMSRTDEDLFKSHQTMLTVSQLHEAVDSIEMSMQSRIDDMQGNVRKEFYVFREEDRLKRKETDTTQQIVRQVDEGINTANAPPEERAEVGGNPEAVGRRGNAIPQAKLDHLDTLTSIINTFPVFKHSELYNKAKSSAGQISAQAESTIRSLERKRKARVDHVFEMHSKFSMAVACILFLFIGAPMGAIVQKGGFGYPLLIAIIFFMVYMILTIFSKNISERFVIEPGFAAWLSCIIMFPFGFLLTYQAMNDYKNVVSSRLTRPIALLFYRLFPKKEKVKPTSDS
ncbi:MAG: LptF/LptG family permease [Saprospiraceae bacterium]|nr:LptF/LptG family permease [Saprospiraceae bacterium]